LSELRRELSRLGRDILFLYRQFEKNQAKVARAIGDADAAPVLEWMFPQPGVVAPDAAFELDLHAVSETMNPDVERQKAVMLSQVVANRNSRRLQLTQLLINPQVAAAPPMLQAINDALTSEEAAYREILEAFEVDDLDAYLTSQGGPNAGNAQLSALTAQLGGVPITPPVAPSGAPGPFGAGGPPVVGPGVPAGVPGGTPPPGQ